MKKILTLVFIVCCMAAKAQEKLKPISDRINNADYIFEGKVIRSNGYYNQAGNIIYTANLVQITKIFKGNDLQCGTVQVITNGGKVGDMCSSFSHFISLSEGVTGVFLCGHDEKELPSPALYQPDNPMALTMIFENQSLISYSYEDYDIKVYDVSVAFEDLQQMYGALVSFTQFNYIDCSNQTLIEPQRRHTTVYRPALMPNIATVSKVQYDAIMTQKLSSSNISGRQQAAGEVDYTISNTKITGSLPKYFEFDVNIGADAGQYLANASFRLQYDNTAFGSNVFTNGKISFTRCSAVADSIEYPYILIQDISSNEVAIGVASGLTPTHQTEFSLSTEKLFHVKIEIANCSTSGTVQFTDQATMLSATYFVTTANGTNITNFSTINATQTVSIPGCSATITSVYPPVVDGGVDDTLWIHGFQFGSIRGIGNVFFGLGV